MNTRSPIDCPALANLSHHAESWGNVHLSELFAKDKARAAQFAAEAPGVRYDYSRQRLGVMTVRLLAKLAAERGFEEWREALLSGKVVNDTENRAAWHTALRAGAAAPAEVKETLQKMKRLVSGLRNEKRYTRIVNLGTGGSDLGPRLLADALGDGTLDVRFAANVDPRDLERALEGASPETTLVVVVSKTFTTQETMANATSAKTWFQARIADPKAIAKHFVAVSTNAKGVSEFGIDTANMFEFWDWVGGRYSLWSAIGLPIMIATGCDNFRALLDGAADMDTHFRTAPIPENMPVILGLLGVWYIDFFDAQSHAVLPYAQDLELLPSYLQQADMESNGKSVDRQGHPVQAPTAPVVWGAPGTNGQHAFHQLLHQGTPLVPCDFIVVAQGQSELAADRADYHQRLLVANALAQTQALMLGRGPADVEAEMKKAGKDAKTIETVVPFRTFSGNRPSTTIMIPKLDPYHLGMLIALYEHKIFVQGAIWQINSFDQWGVELGKQLANDILAGTGAKRDASTAGLLALYDGLKHKK